MTLEVSLAVLLAALLHASWNAMIKGGQDVLMDTAAIVVGAGVVALPFLLVVPLPATASWPYIAASILTHLAYYFFMPTTSSISADITTTSNSKVKSRPRAGLAWYGTLRAVSSACCRRCTK